MRSISSIPYTILATAVALAGCASADGDTEGDSIAVSTSLDGEEAIAGDVDLAGPYEHFNRSIGVPKAVGVPAGFYYRFINTTNEVYRDSVGKIHELSENGPDRHWMNLSDLASAPRAAGDPKTYIDAGNQKIALYRGTDNQVHGLYWWWPGQPVGYDALGGASGAPLAAGNPVGYVQRDGTNDVIYRTTSGNLQEIYWAGTAPARTANITPPGAPNALGDPSPYVNNNGDNIVTYRGTDGHIHGLYWNFGSVGHDNLTAVARAPLAVGDPVAYYTAHNDANQVIYRSADGHLHELWWVGGDTVREWDLMTSNPSAPLAASDAAAYYSASTNTKHVIYRSANGHLNDISWGAQPTTYTDLTVRASATLSTLRPTAFVAGARNSEHVVYRATDGHVHEIRWF